MCKYSESPHLPISPSPHQFFGVGELLYDINLNYLGDRSQEGGKKKKEEERRVERESFLFAGAKRRLTRSVASARSRKRNGVL
ncbi:MAG: hypothetical protein F6K23_10880 [Okeania sp. SIO2C9]|uniref:hypothetical protein n=1 Tax=Okeania sp. SIO2C9 TaxID=2607791 RepID=UPI0013BF32E6|nr:hypothetical protein [Okeania sp. SIO2C9]NEQ73528.1 hypothetical protein [Okeania sp. SIO2C9]